MKFKISNLFNFLFANFQLPICGLQGLHSLQLCADDSSNVSIFQLRLIEKVLQNSNSAGASKVEEVENRSSKFRWRNENGESEWRIRVENQSGESEWRIRKEKSEWRIRVANKK